VRTRHAEDLERCKDSVAFIGWNSKVAAGKTTVLGISATTKGKTAVSLGKVKIVGNGAAVEHCLCDSFDERDTAGIDITANWFVSAKGAWMTYNDALDAAKDALRQAEDALARADEALGRANDAISDSNDAIEKAKAAACLRSSSARPPLRGLRHPTMQGALHPLKVWRTLCRWGRARALESRPCLRVRPSLLPSSGSLLSSSEPVRRLHPPRHARTGLASAQR
jgi:hypothetical protein